MKHRLGKFGTIFLALALVLGMTGAAFATWQDEVQIEGTVEMGSLTLAFDFVEPPICQEGYYDAAGVIVWGEYLDKEVASCDAWYDDYIEDVHSLKEGYKKLVIEINNAYPSYVANTVFKLHNIGTIPLNVDHYVVSGEKRDKDGNFVYNLLWYDPDGDGTGSLWEDVNGNDVVDTAGPDLEVINMALENALPYQLDPCFDNKQEIDLHFKQAAEECHTYTIHVTIVAIQWNKA